MKEKINVGVLFGGRSAEHQVSLVSAESVITHLDAEKYNIHPIGISPAGQWFYGEQALDMLKKGKKAPDLRVLFPADPTEQQLLYFNKNQTQKIDVMFPVLHGTFGEDGTIQGLFELADIPYVGAGVLGSSLSMDKITQKQVCQDCGLPVVNYFWFRSVDWLEGECLGKHPVLNNHIANMPQEKILETIVEKLHFPLFIKPANLGSSVGISKAKTIKELRQGIETALKYDRRILVEAAVENAREIEVAVLGNDKPRAAVPGEVIPSNDFYDYDAKYVDDASDLEIPAKIPHFLTESLQIDAIKCVMACDVQGLARVDFLVNSSTNDYYLNELNTIPGFTSISMYPKMWQASGLGYSELLDKLINLALDRHQQKKALSTEFTPKSDWYK